MTLFIKLNNNAGRSDQSRHILCVMNKRLQKNYNRILISSLVVGFSGLLAYFEIKTRHDKQSENDQSQPQLGELLKNVDAKLKSHLPSPSNFTAIRFRQNNIPCGGNLGQKLPFKMKLCYTRQTRTWERCCMFIKPIIPDEFVTNNIVNVIYKSPHGRAEL